MDPLAATALPFEGPLEEGTPLHRLDARAKIIGLVGLVVVVVTTPANAFWAFALYAVSLAFLLGLGRVPLRTLLKRFLVVAPLLTAVAVFMPFFGRSGQGSYSLGDARVTGEGLLVLWNVGVKALLAVTAMTVLSATTSLSDIVTGLERLRVPRVLVLLVSFMYRYAYVFSAEARGMWRAAASRGFRARWIGNVPVLGHMLASLYLRSYGRGERIYLAMLSRGYDGTIQLGAQTRFGVAETGFVIGVVAVAVTARVAFSLLGSS
jgi:cobalt/nickel transport system permease protein